MTASKRVWASYRGWVTLTVDRDGTGYVVRYRRNELYRASDRRAGDIGRYPDLDSAIAGAEAWAAP